MLILTSHEEQGMIKQLENKKVPINKIEYIKDVSIKSTSLKSFCDYRVNPNYVHDLTPKLQALCAQFQELKEEAKRVTVL